MLELPAWLGAQLGSQRFWLEFASAFGYGAASAVVPILNAEVFIVGALATGLLGPMAIALGMSLGHTAGKLGLLLAIRGGKQLPWLAARRERPVPPGSWRDRWRRWSLRTARLVEDPRYGLPLVFVSAAIGLPPVYLVCLIAATTSMRWWTFSVVLTIGFFVRCYVLALLTAGALSIPLLQR